jgi:hypothetical protein
MRLAARNSALRQALGSVELRERPIERTERQVASLARDFEHEAVGEAGAGRFRKCASAEITMSAS